MDIDDEAHPKDSQVKVKMEMWVKKKTRRAMPAGQSENQ